MSQADDPVIIIITHPNSTNTGLVSQSFSSLEDAAAYVESLKSKDE